MRQFLLSFPGFFLVLSLFPPLFGASVPKPLQVGSKAPEFPDLVGVAQNYGHRSFEIISISVDSVQRKDKVAAFLKKKHAAFRNTLYSPDNKDALAEALDPEWTGALPYTILVAPGGRIIYRHTGIVDVLELKRAIVGHLGRYFFKVPRKRKPKLKP